MAVEHQPGTLALTLICNFSSPTPYGPMPRGNVAARRA